MCNACPSHLRLDLQFFIMLGSEGQVCRERGSFLKPLFAPNNMLKFEFPANLYDKFKRNLHLRHVYNTILVTLSVKHCLEE